MEEIKTLKLVNSENNDDFQVEFEVISPSKNNVFEAEIEEIDNELENIDSYIQELQNEVDRLTNKADKVDYIVAVSSGIITGIIDSVFVGEFNFEAGKEWSNKATNKFIQFAAKQNGYSGDRLNGAIEYLEKKFPVAQDNVWSGKKISSAKAHHLEDFAHHPTIVGMLAGILAEFFDIGLFSSKDGSLHIVKIGTDPKEILKKLAPLLGGIVFSAILKWLIYMAENKMSNKFDKKMPNGIKHIVRFLEVTPALIPIFKVVANWLGHLVSDMGGSKTSAGGGMGIPGIFTSLLKELSALPLLRNTGLPEALNKWVVNNKFDMRKELAVIHELGKQAIPVFINEFLVRGFYFVRRLCIEYKLNGGFKNINWQNVIPFGNRTIERMMTIASGTFCVVDIGDAAIRGAIKSGGNPAAFGKEFLLRINFVGLGRFIVAVGVDLGAGIKRQKTINEVIIQTNRKIALLDAKVFYCQAGTWVEMENTEEATQSLANTMVSALQLSAEMIQETRDNMDIVEENIDIIRNDEETKNKALELLEWS